MNLVKRLVLQKASQRFTNDAISFRASYSAFTLFCIQHGMTSENADKYAADLLNSVNERYTKYDALLREGKSLEEVEAILHQGKFETKVVDIREYLNE